MNVNIYEITKDPEVLKKPSRPFVHGEDDWIIKALLATARAHKKCVGLAGIQIGIDKNVFVAKINGKLIPFVNAEIINKSVTTYTCREGCMSIDGPYMVERHRSIVVEFDDKNGKRVRKPYVGENAQRIQHELDHCLGITIASK